MIEVIETIHTDLNDISDLIVRAAEHALSEEHVHGSITVEIVDAQEIRRLNREFRMIDAVTDVLTFPCWEGEEIRSPKDGYLGDIAICYTRAAEQAAEYGHSLEREISFLTIHGVLHILGYDHMNREDEEVMFRRQDELLNQLGVYRYRECLATNNSI